MRKEKKILLRVLDIVCRHKSFQSNAFESSQDEHDNTLLLIMPLIPVKLALKYNRTAPNTVLSDWRSCLRSSEHIDVLWTSISSLLCILIRILIQYVFRRLSTSLMLALYQAYVRLPSVPKICTQP